MLSRKWFATALLPFLVFGCSSAEDEVDDQGSAARVDPNGTDQPGKVVVVSPTGATGVIDTMQAYMGTTSVKLGEPIGPLRVGNATVGLKTANGPTIPFWYQGNKTVAIRSAQTTTVTTALLGVKATGGPRTFGLGDLPAPTGIPMRAADATTSVNGNVTPSADGTQLLPIYDGKYEINFGLNAVDGVPVTLAEGESKLVTLTDVAQRRIARVKAGVRELPPALCTTTPTRDAWTVSLPNTGSSEALALEDGQEVDLGVSPAHEGTAYVITHGMWSDGIQVPLGERGAGPKTLALGVVDVDDVLINSTQPRVQGTWAIFVANPTTGAAVGNNLLRCKPQTNSGVPMAPGHYRVEVYYNTVESGQKTDVHIIDI